MNPFDDADFEQHYQQHVLKRAHSLPPHLPSFNPEYQEEPSAPPMPQQHHFVQTPQPSSNSSDLLNFDDDEFFTPQLAPLELHTSTMLLPTTPVAFSPIYALNFTHDDHGMGNTCTISAPVVSSPCPFDEQQQQSPITCTIYPSVPVTNTTPTSPNTSIIITTLVTYPKIVPYNTPIYIHTANAKKLVLSVNRVVPNETLYCCKNQMHPTQKFVITADGYIELYDDRRMVLECVQANTGAQVKLALKKPAAVAASNPYQVDVTTAAQRWNIVPVNATTVMFQSCINLHYVITSDGNSKSHDSMVKLQPNVIQDLSTITDKAVQALNRNQQWWFEKITQQSMSKPKYITFNAPCYIYNANNAAIHFALNPQAQIGSCVTAWNGKMEAKKHQLFLFTVDGFVESALDRSLVLDCGKATAAGAIALQKKRHGSNMNQKWILLKSSKLKSSKYIASCVNPKLVIGYSQIGTVLQLQWIKSANEKEQKWLFKVL